MREVKEAVSIASSRGRALLRIICALIFGPAICTAVYLGIQKWFAYCGYTSDTIAKIQSVWTYAGVPITAIVIIVYIFRTLRRRYAYSYMRDYYARLQENGYTVCPRCGSTVSERTGRKSYQKHVGDKITTITYSSGATHVSTTPIYETRSRKYKYHQCDNSSCAIDDDLRVGFGRMPYSRNDLRALILQDYSKTHACAGYLVNGGKHAVRTLLTVLVIAAAAVTMLITKSHMNSIYGQFGGREPEGVSVTAPLGDEEIAYINKAVEIIDKNAGQYRLLVNEQKTGLFQKNGKAEIYGWRDENGVPCLSIRLDRLKTESGISGLSYIMPYREQLCIFSAKDKAIHTPDSDYCKTHFDALKKWDGVSVMRALLDKMQTGELYYMEKTKSYVLRSDRISLYLPEEGSVRILDETGEVPVRYIFSASSKTGRPSDYADFRPAGAADTESDPLQRLLNTADYDAKIEFYENGKKIAGIRYEDRGDGSHSFKFEENYKDFAKGRYVIYPEESRYEFYVYLPDSYGYSKDAEAYGAGERAEIYEWLNQMIPDNYVKANLNLEKAEKGKLLWATTYTEQKEGSGKAVLVLENGKVGKFNCYETDDTYVEIRW